MTGLEDDLVSIEVPMWRSLTKGFRGNMNMFGGAHEGLRADFSDDYAFSKRFSREQICRRIEHLEFGFPDVFTKEEVVSSLAWVRNLLGDMPLTLEKFSEIRKEGPFVLGALVRGAAIDGEIERQFLGANRVSNTGDEESVYQ